MGKIKDLSNTKVGRLLVLNLVGKNKSNRYIWKCLCECGNTVNVASNHLSSGHIKSCGCLRKEVAYRNLEIEFLRNGHYKKEFGISSRNHLYSQYTNKAKKRGIVFLLSKDEFYEITNKACHYCGVEPSQEISRPDLNGLYVYNGVDRVDNSKGYILDNCVPCCKICNRAKSDMTIDDFLCWINRVKAIGNKK